MTKKTAAYGTWVSSITPELMVASNIGLSQPFIHDGKLYWMESRPQEQGRSVIVSLDLADAAADDAGVQRSEVVPAEYNCRTRVHEYGGVSYLPADAGVFFVNFNDQQVYLAASGSVRQLTHSDDLRFADFSYCAINQRLLAVAERHHTDLPEPENLLVTIDIDTGAVSTVHSGEDFYASASYSPDGRQMCWLSWNHPNMPWDGTTLWLAKVGADGAAESAAVVAGGAEESIFQPQWSPSSELYYVSDRSDWWNIYAAKDHRNICEMAAEFGMPQWIFGMRRYAFLDATTIISSYTQSGVESLITIDTVTGSTQQLNRKHSSYESVYAADAKVCYIAQSPHTFPALYVSDAATLHDESLIVSASTLSLSADEISVGRRSATRRLVESRRMVFIIRRAMPAISHGPMKRHRCW